jgi:hypothetical protein
MAQRTIQGSVTDYLDGDASQYDSADVARIKRTTTVDITTKIFVGTEVYHRFQRGGVSGCPNWGDEQQPGTIADAIEQGIDPCENCNPPDYHVTTDITLPLPDEKPTEVADIDPIVYTTGNVKRTAHIAAQDGDNPTPLCGAVGTYTGRGKWDCRPQAVYPNPSEWFARGLCSECLAAYDEIDGGQDR